MKLSIIKKTSPLYGYWESDQEANDERDRMLKINNHSPASSLYKNEPYKWENLYQSIIREILNGDQDSIRGLNMLLDTVNKAERDKVEDVLSKNQIFSEQILKKLRTPDKDNVPTKRNTMRFLRILFSIFTNPYNIQI